MSLFLRFSMLATLLVVAACAGQQARTKTSDTPAAAKSVDTNAQPVKSSNGHAEGEIIGTPARNSKFAKLKIGFSLHQVNQLIGTPDDIDRHETGKRWIPFYFGADVQRLEAFYKGEGCLTYTGGNQFGAGGNKLIRIVADPRGTCMN